MAIPLSIPKTIGPYQLQEEIGRGGMSVVYRALDTINNRVIALKVLPPELAFNETYLDRFIREGKNTLTLRYPNIVRVYESGLADSYHYIALETRRQVLRMTRATRIRELLMIQEL